MVPPAPATHLVDNEAGIDLGDRFLRLVPTPGHSPGHVALFEETGVLFAQDAVYDGPSVDTCYHSDIGQYLATMALLDRLEPRIVHAGHFASFGAVRMHRLIAAYRTGKEDDARRRTDGAPTRD